MATLKLPLTQTIFADRPYTPKVIDSLFPFVKSRSEFSSLILTAQRADHRLLLFILEARPYAAGRLTDDRFEALTLRNFFKDLAEVDHPTITLFETNPVLFKCHLVLVQKTPTTVGTTDLVNVEGLLKRLKTSKQEAVVSLRRTDELNLFYFAKGKLYEVYFANPSAVSKDSTPDDQFLEYAYTVTPASPVMVQAYEDVKVGPAEDHELAWEDSPEGIVGYFLKARPELIFLSGGSTIEKKIIHKKVFTLRIENGPRQGTVIPLRGKILIGRTKADINTNDPKVSRQHACIEEKADGYYYTDLNSTNGSFINNQPVQTKILAPGDTIQVGDTLFSVIARTENQDEPLIFDSR